MAERVGVIGEFDTAAFNAGLNVYINGLLRSVSATVSAVTRINSLIGSIKPIRKVNLTDVVSGGGDTQAISNITSQINRLSKVKPVDSAVVTSLNGVANALTTLSAVPNLDNVSKNLSSVVKGLSGLGNIKGISPAVTQTLTGFVTGLSGLSAIGNLGDVTKNINNVVKALSAIGNLKAPQGSIFQTLSGLVNVLTRLSGITNIGTTVQGISALITGLGRLGKLQPIPAAVVTSIQQLLGVITRFAGVNTGGIANLASVLNSLPPVLRNYSSAAQQAGVATNSLFSSLATGVGVGIGASAVQLFNNLTRAVRNLISEAFGLIQFFEGFALSVQTTVAAQIVAEDSTIAFADALEIGEARAFGFQKVLQQLAIQSKFTTREVAESFQTAIGRSFDPDQALRVTKALVDFTSGRGLSADKMNLIALALGQINSAGRVLAQDLNQLTSAGVNVGDILSKAFGKSKEEIVKLREDGLLPSQAVIEAIISSMEKDFAGAAARTQGTLSGLVSSLIDIKELAFAQFFKAAFDPIIPTLQAIVALLASDKFLATLQILGGVLGVQILGAVNALKAGITGLVTAFNSLSPETKKAIFVFIAVGAAVTILAAILGGLSLLLGLLINPFTILVTVVAAVVTGWTVGFGQLTDIVNSAANSIATTIGSLLTTVVDWGKNIVTSLADGIISAVDAVIDALNFIGQAISFLLSPGSPPRLLPDLERWGMGAAEVYLEGWTKANFIALDQFGSILEKRIRQAVELGTVKEGDSFKFQLISRQQLAEAISQIQNVGFVTQDTIQKIAAVSGFPAEVIGRLLSRYAGVVDATRDVATAQNALNAITKQYVDILKPLEDRLNAINTAKDRADDEAKLIKLRRIAANATINDSRRQAALAEIEQIELENQIDTIKSQQTAEVDLAQVRVDTATQQATFAQDQLDLYIAQLNAQTANVDIQIKQREFIQAQLDALNKIVTAVGSIGDKIKEGLTPLEKQLQAIKFQQEELADMIELKKQEAILNDENATAAQKAAAQLKIQEIQIRRNIRALDAKEAGVDLSVIQGIPIVLADIEKAGKGAKGSIDGLTGAFKGATGIDIDGKLAAFNLVVKDVKTSFDEFGVSFNKVMDDIDAKLPSFLKIKEQADGTRPGIDALGKGLLVLGGIITGGALISGIVKIAGAFGGVASVIGTVTKATGLTGAISGLIALIGAPLLIALGVASVAVGAFYVAWQNNWFGIRDKIMPIVVDLQKKLTDFVTTNPFFLDVKAKLTEVFNSLKSFFVDTDWNQVIVNVVNILGGIWTQISTKVSESFTKFMTHWESLGDDWLLRSIRLVGEVVGGIARWLIGTGLPLLLNAIKNLVLLIFVQLPAMLDPIGDAVSDFIFKQSGVFLDNLIKHWVPAFFKWVPEATLQLQTYLFDLGVSIRSYIDEKLTPALKDAGFSIWAGIRDGFSDALGDVIPPEWALAFTALMTAVNLWWGIGSPSTKMRDDVGVPIGEGLIQGLVDELIAAPSKLIAEFKLLLDSVFSQETLDYAVGKAKGLGVSIIQGLKDAFTDPVGTAKKAFTDLIDGIFGAGEDEAETKSPSKRAKRDIGEQISAGIAEGLTVANLLTTIATFITGIILLFIGMATSITFSVAGLSLGLIAAFLLLKTTLIETTTVMVDDLLISYDSLQTGGQEKVDLLVSGVKASLILLKTESSVILTEIKEAFIKAFDDAAVGVQGAMTKLKGIVLGELSKLLTSVRTDFVEKGENVGEDFIRGIIKGIANEIDDIKKAAAAAVNAAINAAKEASNAQSPSKRSAKEIGEPFSQGIALGMENQLRNLMRSASQITGGLFETVSGQVASRLSNSTSSSVTHNNTNNWNLNVNSTQSTGSIRRDFGIMQVMAGT